MFIENLERRFGANNPIFVEDILAAESNKSRPTVYRMIQRAVEEGTLMRYDRGIYYIPKQMEFGLAVPSVDRVVEKKYIGDNGEVYGIYGKLVMEVNFALSTQVPNTIEVITNKEKRDVREIEIRNRKVILRKSRLPITSENAAAYTLLELFNGMNMKEYNDRVRRRVLEYAQEKNVTRQSLMGMAAAFPARAVKNMAMSGVLYEVV